MIVMIKRPSKPPVITDTGKESFSIRNVIGNSVIKVPFGDDIVLLAGTDHKGFRKFNFRFEQNEDSAVYGTALFLSRSAYVDAEFESLSLEQRHIIEECFPANIYSDLDKHEMREALSTAYIESRVKGACMHSGSSAGALIGADELSAILFPPSENEADEFEPEDEQEATELSTYAEPVEEDASDAWEDGPLAEDVPSHVEVPVDDAEEEPLLKPDAQEIEDIRRQKEDADDLLERSLRSLDDLLEKHAQAPTKENSQALSFDQYYKIIIDGRSLLDEYLAETSNLSISEEVGLGIREIILDKYMERAQTDTAFFDDIREFISAVNDDNGKDVFLYNMTRELIGSMDLKAEYARRHTE